MEPIDQEEVRARLQALIEEHRDLDMAIEALMSQTGHDALQVQRLKKRKLKLKDEIQHMQDLIVPDIIA